MTLRVFVPRLAWTVCAALGLAGTHTARAQTVDAVIAPSTLQAPSPTPTPVPYHDHYIAGGTLAPDLSADSIPTSASTGLARSLQVDAVASVLTSTQAGSQPTEIEDGLIVRSRWDTAAYGAWSLDASARTGGSGLGPSASGQGGVFTLRQRAMPFDGGWQADNSLGDINSPDISLARLQTRFYLPTTPIQGLSTEWRGPDGLQIVAGGGEPGLYDGIEVPDFRTLGGATATAGAQWAPAEHWLLGTQFITAHDVDLVSAATLDDSAISSSTGLMSTAWQNAHASAQLNVLDGEISDHRNGLGAWLDTSWNSNRLTQNAGVFRIDPNLTWGNQLIADDVQGGYYRVGYQSRQWLLDGGLDEVRSVSGLGDSTTFLTGDARYQVLRDWGVGSVVNAIRNEGGDSYSLEGYLDHIDRWGTSRAQVDWVHSPSGEESTLTLQQAFTTHTGVHLNASMALDRLAQSTSTEDTQDATALRLALYGGGQLSARLGFESNVQWAVVLAGRAAPGISATASLSWQVAPAWTLLLSYYDSEVGAWTPLVVQSPLTPPVPSPISAAQERGIFLTLRYQRSSGSHFAPLGGAPGTGSGSIAGVVYLDANGNKQQDANEQGVANLTVILDGRFSAQTDDTGHFEFPAVAAGHHVITVSSDNLPLPWVVDDNGRVDVQVATRGQTTIGIAATRMR
jgi:hypothetical protein